MVRQVCDLPFSASCRALLFHLLSKIYERANVALTSTNISFRENAEVFGEAKLTAVLLGRVNHHCHILETSNDNHGFRACAAAPKPRKE